jgi:hypothetical protein
MRTALLLFTTAFLFSYSATAQDDPSLPSAKILRQHHVRKLKVATYYSSDTSRPAGRPSFNEKYTFNRKGLMIRSRKPNIKNWYHYDKEGRLIAVSKKWSVFTNAWWEGYARQCTTYEYGTGHIIVREYGNTYRRINKKQEAKTVYHLYRDSFGRDSLLVTARNSWYYAGENDTGTAQTTYRQIDSSAIQQTIVWNYPRNRRTETNIIKMNRAGQVAEIYREGGSSVCPRRTFEYKKGLLKKVVHYNCLGAVNSFDIYKYH